jgi:enolase
MEAIIKAGYKPGEDVSICIDPAASEMWEGGKYKMFKSSGKVFSSDDLIKLWEEWINKYPIVLLEDGLAQNDWKGWENLTQLLGEKIEIVGDDIFCTNKSILAEGIKRGVANSVIIKLNQIGTVTEALETIDMAYRNNYNVFVSHRSGETSDSFIADLAVAVNAGHIKTGSGCRSERIEKFNQLIRIENELGRYSKFAGNQAFKNVN